MPHISEVELDHCKELVMVPGSLFEFTSRFIATERQQQLLALYALSQLIGSVPVAATDDAVKWAKLKWWSEELIAEPASPSRHPVLRALWTSGARKHLDDKLLLRLVKEAVMQIDAAPDADEKAMFDRLAVQKETEILLELALDGDEIETRAKVCLAAASGLFGMIPAFFSHHRADSLQLPLNLTAKYQLQAIHFEQNPPAEELVAAVSQLAARGVEWFAEGMTILHASSAMPSGKHLQLRWAMEARLLARMSRSAKAHLRNGTRFGLSDAWFAWQFCRRLARMMITMRAKNEGTDYV